MDASTNSAALGDAEIERIDAAVIAAVQSGASLKDLQGVSKDLMDGIYAFAYQFYQQGRLDDAETFFRFLCIYDFYNAEYALGLAAVFQLKKNYAKAVDLYALAFSLSKEDYRPIFHTGECHLMAGKAGLARRCFSAVVERSSDARLKERAASYLSGLDEVRVGAQKEVSTTITLDCNKGETS
ncbi:type III secretion system translocator chaperone SicA [Paraburkholderia sp. BR10882]|uniref:type III secretion system translocator chaperone SicA n=1 Tax=unclassified Paraburkholderia TaxID=2615204 RepID=UPI0034CDCD0E